MKALRIIIGIFLGLVGVMLAVGTIALRYWPIYRRGATAVQITVWRCLWDLGNWRCGHHICNASDCRSGCSSQCLRRFVDALPVVGNPGIFSSKTRRIAAASSIQSKTCDFTEALSFGTTPGTSERLLAAMYRRMIHATNADRWGRRLRHAVSERHRAPQSPQRSGRS